MSAPYISWDDLNFQAATLPAEDFKKLLKTYQSSGDVISMQNGIDGYHYDDGTLYRRFDTVRDEAAKKKIMTDFRAGIGEFARRPGTIRSIFAGLAAKLCETPQIVELKTQVQELTERLAEMEKTLKAQPSAAASPASPGAP